MKLCVCVITFLLLSIIPTLTCAATLSLQQCIDLGLEVNPHVKAYRMAIDEAEEGISEAWGAFLPTLSVNYGHTRLINNGGIGYDTDYLSQNSDSFSVRLTQPLFTGMAGMAGLSKARQSRTYREFELQYVQQQLVFKIRQSFNDILKEEQLVNRWAESVGRLENQKKIAQAWVEQQLAPRLRLLEVDVEYSNSLQQLVSAEAALVIAKANLKEWLALPEDEFLVIGGDLHQSVLREDFQQPTFVNCSTSESCLEQALEQRIELQLAQLNISMAREDIKAIRARNLPRISFDAGWTDYQREFDTDYLSEEDRNYYTLSLNLSMRPFQGGKNIFAFRKQKLLIKRLEYENSRQINTIKTEVNTHLERLLEGESQISSAVIGVAAAREAYDFADRATKLGVSSLDDLLNAEKRLTQAEINQINAEHAIEQARIRLDYVVGSQSLIR
ncbi:MAG: TolC family protein [Desulfuromusa sp.]|nr:TolC family protein [Desulfuromusa sp.]